MQGDLIKPKMTFGSHLRFTPYAWAKLLYMRDRGDTEVAGYGVTGTEDPLLVTDFVLVKQKCTTVTFDLDPEDGVEHAERMMDKGIPPWACMNILIHTHPGDSPSPSGVDEKNFKSAFSHPNWAIMFIIAEGGSCYCRMKVNVGPGSINELKVAVDWSTPFCGSDPNGWEDEYKAKVSKAVSMMKMTGKEGTKVAIASTFPGHSKSLYRNIEDIKDPFWWNEEDNRWGRLSEAEEAELDRLGQEAVDVDTEIDFDCHWDYNGDVAYWNEETNSWFFFNPVDSKWCSETDDEGAIIGEIDRPTDEWAKKVEDWALQFSDERTLSIGD